MDIDNDFDYFLVPTSCGSYSEGFPPRELFMGDEANQTGSSSTREIFVQGSGQPGWQSHGEDGGAVLGAIADIGAYEYRIYAAGGQ